MERLSRLLAVVVSLGFLYVSIAVTYTYSGEDKTKATEHKVTKEEIGKEFSCVLCNMKMKVSKNTPALDYRDKTYYFCSAGEKKSFSQKPEKFISRVSNNQSSDFVEHKIEEEELGKKAACPVTKESFTVTRKTPAIEYKGKVYYFCCPGCTDKFIQTQTESDSLKVEPDSPPKPEEMKKGEVHNHNKCG